MIHQLIDRPKTRLRTLIAAILSLALLTGLLVVLVRLGHGPLAPPPHASVDAIRAWAESRGPVTVALALVRLIALGVGGQVLAATGLTVAGGVLRAPALLHVGQAISLPAFRPLVRRLAGLSLSATTLLTPSPSHAAISRPSPVVLERISASPRGPSAVLTRLTDSRAAHETATLTQVDPGAGSATMRRVDEPMPTAKSLSAPDTASIVRIADTAPASSPTEATPSRPLPAPTQPPASGERTTWSVQHGDHLWSIAESTLTTRWHRAPSEAEVDRYWGAVVRANPQVEHPDLIFPGQVITLPSTS